MIRRFLSWRSVVKPSYQFGLFAVLQLASPAAWAATTPTPAPETVCVLNYERKIHPMTHELEKIFANDPKAKLTSEAVPIDLLKCLQDGAEEVIIFAHALEDPSDANNVRLGYFSALSTPADKQAFADTQLKIVDAQLASEQAWLAAVIKADNDYYAHHRSIGKGGPAAPSDYRIAQAHTKISDLQSTENQIKKLATGSDDIYLIKSFLPQAFRVAENYLDARKKSGQPILTKRIRLVSCLPQDVLKRYPELPLMAKDNGIDFDVAPQEDLMSFLMGKTVTALDPDWFGESAQPDTGPDNDWFYAYINMKTFLVESSGQAIALHGKYQITVNELALGLGSDWTEMFIKYGDVKSLNVGDKKVIRVPHVAVEMALGVSLDADIDRHPQLTVNPNMNNIGVSLSIFSTITIERLY
jgi:hypothetical protein